MTLIERYCRKCNQATHQKHIGVEVRRKGNIDLYQCIYCDSIWRVTKVKSPLENNLTEDKLKEARNNGM